MGFAPLLALVLLSCVSSPRQTPDTLTAAPPAEALLQVVIARNDSTRRDTLFVKPDLSQFTRMSSGLHYREVRVGTGTPATDFRELGMEYNGWLEDGTMFDSSRRRDSLFVFTLGRDRVIPGWEAGVLGMRAGGRRILVVPPGLAYGADGRPPVIPPGATLIFDIELHKVR